MRSPHTHLLGLSLALAALAGAPQAEAQAQEPGFVHVQLDKPLYRLGDTVWYRAHRDGDPGQLTLTLRGPGGEVLETAAFGGRSRRPAEGSFFLEPDHAGGTYRLVATAPGPDGAADLVQHEVAFEVYDVRRRELDLSLRVLGEVFYPGDTVTAAVSARALDGRPVAGEVVRYRATLGALTIQGETAPTDAEGRALVRFAVPEQAVRGGHLAVGLEAGERLEAVAHPLRVSGSISRVDAFPEGGAVVPGQPHRVGLLVRDLDGEPTPAEGRVFDDLGTCVAVFRADVRGCAQVVVPAVDDRSYAVQIDRPARVEERFLLPQATGHAQALRVERDEAGVRVRVWGEEARGEVVVVDSGGGEVQRSDLRLRQVEDEQGLCAGAVTVRSQDDLQGAWVLWVVDGRARLMAPVVLGESSPLLVEVAPLTRDDAPPLPGDEVALEITATLRGQPVETDLALSAFNTGVTEDGRNLLADLAARHLLAPLVADHASDAGQLFAPGLSGAETASLCDAYLLVRGACAPPPDGLPLEDGGLPDLRVARALPPAIERRPEPDLGPAGTATRADGLELLLRRAPYTRSAAPRAGGDRGFARALAPGLDQAVPGLGRPARRPPQDVRIGASQVDSRDTMCWEAQVRTDRRGKAVVRFRVSHEVSDLAVVVQGFGQGVPVSSAGHVEPQGGFSSRSVFPEHLRVGDRFEVLTKVLVRDGDSSPLQVSFLVPDCLRALDRTELTHQPGRSAREHKLRFEVISPAQEAGLVVVTTRGLFREEVRHTFDASYAELELSYAEQGLTDGSDAVWTLEGVVPPEAVPGSVVARTRVAPRTTIAPGSAMEDLESLLRAPYGCFEQTTSINYPNLMVLDALLETGTDTALLERAYDLATTGYQRLLTFRDTASGGFGLYPGNAPAATYTARAVVQLSHYRRLFDGQGSAELFKALEWLNRHGGEVDGVQLLNAALGTREAGVPWPGQTRVAQVPLTNRYMQALLADCLALGDAPWPADAERPADEVLTELLDGLEKVQDEQGLVHSDGVGIMRSSGHSLALETTAFAACAWLRAGRLAPAQRALEALLANKGAWGGWGHTWATATALRAMALSGQLSSTPAGPLPEVVGVSFSTGPGAPPMASFTGGGVDRPVTLSRSLHAAPGDRVQLRLEVEADEPVDYGLGFTYRVAHPRSSPQAPYTLSSTLSADQLPVAGELSLRVALRRTQAALGDGQVVAKLALPGGCRPTGLVGLAGSARQDVEDGYLVLYWETPPEVLSFSVPLEALVAGDFHTAPSVVYPYYEPGREAYAAGQELRILPQFDLDLGAAAIEQGALQGR
jgi:A-macroglobulin TED domain